MSSDEFLDPLEHTSIIPPAFGSWSYDISRDRFQADALVRELLRLPDDEAFGVSQILARFHPHYDPVLSHLFAGGFEAPVLLTVQCQADDLLPRYINVRTFTASEGSRGIVHGLIAESSSGLRMREEIAYSRSRFDVLAAAIPNAFMYLDSDLAVEFASETLAKALGKPLDAVVGRHVSEALGPEEYARHAEQIRKALQGESVTYEATVAAPHGGIRNLRISTGPVRNASGHILGVVSEATDITDLRALEVEARKGEAAFRMLAQGVPNHLLFVDRNLHVRFANDAFLEAAGWTLKEAVGRHMVDIVGEERYLQRKDYYARVLAGENVSYETEGAAGSATGYFRFTYRPAFDARGNVIGIFSTAVDITERRKAELALEAKQAELARSNKDLEQFAYVASHDLKSPLRAIDVLVGWITESLEGYEDPEVHENLALLAKRTGRLSRLLDDLLNYSRAGRKVGEFQETDVHGLVLDVIELCAAPDRIVSIGITGRLPVISTYPVPLEQVFRNLIGNAIKHYAGTEGRIVIACEEDDRHYTFAVQDNGSGIPPEYSEKVFEMFQTLQPRDQVEGSGMGLAIVKRIVTWQGGRVWFEPAPAGPGTVFKFEWIKQAQLAKAGNF